LLALGLVALALFLSPPHLGSGSTTFCMSAWSPCVLTLPTVPNYRLLYFPERPLLANSGLCHEVVSCGHSVFLSYPLVVSSYPSEHGLAPLNPLSLRFALSSSFSASSRIPVAYQPSSFFIGAPAGWTPRYLVEASPPFRGHPSDSFSFFSTSEFVSILGHISLLNFGHPIKIGCCLHVCQRCVKVCSTPPIFRRFKLPFFRFILRLYVDLFSDKPRRMGY